MRAEFGVQRSSSCFEIHLYFSHSPMRLLICVHAVPPVITKAPGRKIAEQGVEFSVECAATGTPPLSFAFYKVLLVVKTVVHYSHCK